MSCALQQRHFAGTLNAKDVELSAGNQKSKALGRPPRPQDQVRSERVVTFLTFEECESLKRLSDAWGKSVSATCHRLVQKALISESQDRGIKPASSIHIDKSESSEKLFLSSLWNPLHSSKYDKFKSLIGITNAIVERNFRTQR